MSKILMNGFVTVVVSCVEDRNLITLRSVGIDGCTEGGFRTCQMSVSTCRRWLPGCIRQCEVDGVEEVALARLSP